MRSAQKQMDIAVDAADAGNRPYSGVYDRDAWPHWRDPDGNGCNARDDALISQATGNIVVKKNSRCDVISGTWRLPYSNEVHTGNSSLVQADHVIPLSYAHKHGGMDWSTDRKMAFANDPDNILIVSAKLNRQKSDSGPSLWMPPYQPYRCLYLSKFDGLMVRHGLAHTAQERRVLKKMHSACDLPPPAS